MKKGDPVGITRVMQEAGADGKKRVSHYLADGLKIQPKKDGGLQRYFVVTARERFPHTVADLAKYGQDK